MLLVSILNIVSFSEEDYTKFTFSPVTNNLKFCIRNSFITKIIKYFLMHYKVLNNGIQLYTTIIYNKEADAF